MCASASAHRGCARTEAAALRALSAEATLLSWLKGILLGCKSAMVRREVAAAVYALGCDAPDLMLEGDGDPKPVRAPVALCLQNLLPSVRDVVSRGGQGATREYFELTHAMVARVLRDARRATALPPRAAARAASSAWASVDEARAAAPLTDREAR